MGASSRYTLPLPVMVTLREAASCAFTSFADSEAFMENFPTPPPNEAGAPAGSGDTLTVYDLE